MKGEILEGVRPQNLIELWINEKIFMGMTLSEYRKRLLTPFHIISALIIIVGVPLILLRYINGLGAVTHASQDQPFGLFLGWGLFTGVPLSATGFLMASAVYLFGLKEYKSLVRPAILTGFVGYAFAVIYLLIDLGRPWRLPYPMFYSFGPGSVLFLVAWHVALYLSVQFLEFSPDIFEWLETKKLRAWVLRITIGATIFGVILSTLHQSALGALFLLAPGKLHPLWYTPYLPVLFFVSAIFAGLSMVIVESTLVYRFLRDKVAPENYDSIGQLTLGLGKAASFALFTYFCLKVLGVAHSHSWHLLATPWGAWFLLEMFGFVLLPCFFFLTGVRNQNVSLVRFTAFLTVIGIACNRLTVSLLASSWRFPQVEIFHGKEFIIVLTVITIEILVYRWVVNRLPVHREDPKFPGDGH